MDEVSPGGLDFMVKAWHGFQNCFLFFVGSLCWDTTGSYMFNYFVCCSCVLTFPISVYYIFRCTLLEFRFRNTRTASSGRRLHDKTKRLLETLRNWPMELQEHFQETSNDDLIRKYGRPSGNVIDLRPSGGNMWFPRSHVIVCLLSMWCRYVDVLFLFNRLHNYQGSAGDQYPPEHMICTS